MDDPLERKYQNMMQGYQYQEYSGDEDDEYAAEPVMSLEQQKEELKRKLQAISSKGKKKTDPKNPYEYEEINYERQPGKVGLGDFKFLSTLGTGTFGRVRLVKKRDDNTDSEPLALKCLKKSEIIRLKQIEHVKSEEAILETIGHPFIVNLKATFQT